MEGMAAVALAEGWVEAESLEVKTVDSQVVMVRVGIQYLHH